MTWSAVSTASDRQREIDYADYVQQHLTNGRAVWLPAKDQSFLGLLSETERNDKQFAAIILHDHGEYPDQQPLVHRLRTVLPKHNWLTLAVQLPLWEAGAEADDYFVLFDEAGSRIHAAVAYLRDRGVKHIALVGVGMGAAMAAYKLDRDPEALLALVAISLPLPDNRLPQAQIGNFMRNIALPFLDIYAEFDLPEVLGTAAQRRLAAKDNPAYRQYRIDGEDHAYRHDPNRVVKRVYSWLALHADID